MRLAENRNAMVEVKRKKLTIDNMNDDTSWMCCSVGTAVRTSAVELFEICGY